MNPQMPPSRPRRRRDDRGTLDALRSLAVALLFAGSAAAVPIPWSAGTAAATLDGVRQVAIGDVDGDGAPDLVVAADVDDEIAWIEDTGSGFVRHTIEAANGAFAVRLGDVDRDGTLDVVFSARDANTVRWLSNELGDGSSWVPGGNLGTAATGVTDLELGDLDGDGDLDVVGAVTGATDVRWWERTGSGWTVRTLDGGAGAVDEVELADVDGDGDLDVVGANASVVGWWENPSPSTAVPWTRTQISPPGDPAGLEAVDFDRDGDVDVVVGDRTADTVSWWANDGTGAAGTWVSTAVGPLDGTTALGAVDVDRDGALDLLATADDGVGTSGWFDGGDAFAWRPIAAGAPAAHAAAADFDLDGDPDVVTVDPASGEVRVFTDLVAARRADFPTYANNPVGTANGILEQPTQGDLDGDGDVDLALLDDAGIGVPDRYRVVWFENLAAPNGSGQATMGVHVVGTPTAIFENATDLEIGDLDGDGDADLLIGQNDAVNLFLTWCENTAGDGTAWTCAATSEETVGAERDIEWDMDLGDLDGDGDLDLVAYIENWNLNGTYGVRWYENLGDMSVPGNWREHEIAQLQQRKDLQIVDIDGDGDRDVVTTDSTIQVFLNDDGSGTSWTQESPGGGGGRLAIGDVDLDGDLDLATYTTVGASYRWWERLGGGTWTSHDIETFPLGGGTVSDVVGVDLADLDLDGDLDVLGSFETRDSGTNAFIESDLVWYENRLREPAAGWLRHGLPHAFLPGPVYAFDVDGDADPDFVLHDGSIWQYVFLNTGATLGGMLSAIAPGSALEAEETPVARLDLAHHGRTGDRDAAPIALRLLLLDATHQPLDQNEANALFGTLRVRVDDGDGIWETADTVVATVTAATVTDGVFEVGLGAARPETTVPCCGTSVTWFVSLEAATGSAAALGGDIFLALEGAAMDAVDTVDELPVATEPFFPQEDVAAITLVEVLFADGFESGDTGAWAP